MPEKDRRRALRRHHRARVIARRVWTARQLELDGWSAGPRAPGGLARGQIWLGCNRPKCGVCHPGKKPGYADRQRAREAWRRDWLG